MALVLSHFGDLARIPMGAVLEAETMGGYRIEDNGACLTIRLTHPTSSIRPYEANAEEVRVNG